MGTEKTGAHIDGSQKIDDRVRKTSQALTPFHTVSVVRSLKTPAICTAEILFNLTSASPSLVKSPPLN